MRILTAHTLKWSHSQNETNTDVRTHMHTESNNKLKPLGSGRTKSHSRCQCDGTYSTNTPALITGLFLATLLAHIALYTLRRVKERLSLELMPNDENGCQMMQWEKHKLNDISVKSKEQSPEGKCSKLKGFRMYC